MSNATTTTYTFNNNHGVNNTNTDHTCNGDMPYNHGDAIVTCPHGNERKQTESNIECCGRDKKDTVVHIKNPDSHMCSRTLNNRERYLVVVCFLLFFACITFIFIALIKDWNYRTKNGKLTLPNLYA